MLNEAAQNGQWCFLSNCHLSLSLLPELESIMDALFKKKLSENFRLFLSASPVDGFPISLLQRSLKIAQEPPRGIRANMMRIYGNKSREFTPCQDDKSFRKAVFGLAWFHSVLLERKKFKTLGWNVSYAFNDSDYQVCEDSIANYMGRISETSNIDYVKGAKTPWQAIQYLIADCNYGGRITDERDRRLIKVYAKEIFEDNLIGPEKWVPIGTDQFNYVYPADEKTNL
jgi:dynein heavy chain